VHDIVDLELRGVPSVMIASTEFVRAADVQAASLGVDVQRVFVAHPIQDRTDDEMVALADAAVDDVVAALVQASE
jgi:hypothetical protein